MDIAVSAQHRVAIQNIRKDVQMVAGRQHAHHLIPLIDRDAVNVDPAVRNLAFKHAGDGVLPLHGLHDRLFHILVAGGQRVIRFRSVSERVDDALALPRKIGDADKVIRRIDLIQAVGKCLAGHRGHIAQLQKGGQGVKKLKIAVHLPENTLFIFLRFRLHLFIHVITQRANGIRHDDSRNEKKNQADGHHESRHPCQQTAQLVFIHRLTSFSARRAVLRSVVSPFIK